MDYTEELEKQVKVKVKVGKQKFNNIIHKVYVF